MENEIMLKSGISIAKESESPRLPPSTIARQNTPATTSSASANFVSGTEEDLNVGVVDIDTGAKSATTSDLD